MEQLREAVYLRSYSQKILYEYKIEGSNMFEELIQKIKDSVVNQIYRIKIETVSSSHRTSTYSTQNSDYQAFTTTMGQSQGAKEENAPKISTTIVNSGLKVGRNDPCPCGSGKKYKQCCGK